MPAGSPTATLLLSCPDQKGLVAAVSAFLYEHNGNIIHADQHTDQQESAFLQRVEWELDGFGVPRGEIAREFAPIAERFGMQWTLRFSDVRPNVALLVSRQAHCMYDLLARYEMGELRCEIPVIISNHADLAPVAAAHGLAYHHLPVRSESKQAQEAAMHELLDANEVDVIVLARYMQILSSDFVDRFQRRIINIHHSFLPAFAGARPYHQAHERGVKIIGATAHYVTAELDSGPIIAQGVSPVSHRDSVDDLVQIGSDLEKTVLAKAVRLHLDNRVLAYGNRTVIFD